MVQQRIAWLALIVLLMMALPQPASAQAKLSGEINGIVAEETGDPLPGVTVTILSEKMFQKSQTVISGDKGLFRFLNLNAGIYTVELALPGFNPVRLTDVEVRLGQTTSLKLKMAPAAITAEVKVIALAPLIETKTVQLSTNYTSKTVEDIPTGRNVLDLMESVPGINDRGAYGAGGYADSGYYQGSSTNGYMFNGVDVSDLESGATWVNPNYDTIEEIQVVGVGASAEYGNFSGAVLNVITKAGTNTNHGGLSMYYSDSDLMGDNSGGVLDLKPEQIKYDPEITGYMGGPIIKEKLFFFLAGGYTATKSKRYGDVAYSSLKQPHFQGRLDWVPSTRNQFSFVVNSDPLNHDNLGLKAGSGEEIGYSRVFRSTAWHASWQFLMNSKTYLNIKYSGFNGRDVTDPNSPDAPGIKDYSTYRFYGSSGMIVNNLRNRNQVNATLTHYVDNFLAASHEFKFGAEYEISKVKNNEDGTGSGLTDIRIVPVGDQFFAYGWLGNNVHTEGKVNRIAAFVQDNIQIGKKVNLNLGLRYDNTRVSARSVSGAIIKLDNLAPRLGISYDLTGDAKNVLRAGFGRYYDKVVTSGFVYALPGMGNLTAWCRILTEPFDPTPENIENFGDYILSNNWCIFSQPSADLIPVDQNIHSPYTDVFNFGYEKALFRDWALSLGYIYKRDRGLVVIDSKTEHTYQEVPFTDPDLGTTITLWDQVDRLPDEWFYTNSSWMKRNHHMAILSLKKRPSDNWSLMSSLVYQNSRGNTDNTMGPVTENNWGLDTDPVFTQNPLQWGYLTYNRTWQFKLLGTYELPMGFTVSGNFRILSGLNWQPDRTLLLTGMYRDSSSLSFIRIPVEQRGTRRMPMTYFLDARISKVFRVGRASNIELIADALNVLNRANIKNFHTALGTVYPISQEEAFGKAASLYPPITFRIGARWTF